VHVRVRVRVRRVRVRAVWAWVNTGERDDKCEVIIIIVYEEKERVGTGACGPAGAPRVVPRQRGVGVVGCVGGYTNLCFFCVSELCYKKTHNLFVKVGAGSTVTKLKALSSVRLRTGAAR
jgi:hypothetical protein